MSGRKGEKVRGLAATILAAALACGAAAGEPEVKFAEAPNAVKEGKAVRITFKLSRKTDVAVYIEDGEGKVVRHLAAGVLGDKAPRPLAAGKLAQSLLWDRRDDAGKPVPAGKYRVRVAAGLEAGYAGTAFESKRGPGNITNVIGLAAGPGGRVYVMTNRWRRIWWSATTIHVFYRDGAYERTIKPMPASVPPERLEDLSAFKRSDGLTNPVIHRILAMSFYPFEDTGHQMAVTRDGRLHFVVTPAAYTKGPVQRLATIDSDGGLPCEDYAGELLLDRAAIGRLHLAPASSGKAVYLTGLGSLDSGFNTSLANPPAVYVTKLPQRGALKPFFGDPETPGKGERGLKDPRGIATDGKGRLFIADRGNNRIVVVDEKTRKFAGSFPVPAPTWVGVHHKTGAVYVASAGALVKFSGWKKPRELARLQLPPITGRHAKRTRRLFALDPESSPAVLWIGRNMGGTALLRCEEKGDKFGPAERAGYRPSRTFWNLSADPSRRKVACKLGGRTLRVMDEKTGKWRDFAPLGSSGQTYRLGPKGQIYGQDHSGGGVRRWDANCKPLPFRATAADPKLRGRLPSRPSGTTAWERDFCVDRAGNVYTKHRGPFYHGRKRVDVYDKNGKFKRTAIWVVTDGALGPRLDPSGNIYMAEAIKPLKKRYPDEFKAPIYRTRTKQQYTWMYGSVVKFGPAGGAFWFPKLAKDDAYAFDGEPKLPAGLKKEKFSATKNGRMVRETGELQGALWWRFGCSYLLDMHVAHNQRCHCTAAEFDVDAFGRTFYPDQGRFRVVVLDTAGNEILSFGGYGNQDSCGPESYVLDPREKRLRPPREGEKLTSPFAKPEVGIAWIVGLCVSDRYAYIADGLNRRVLRARLAYKLEAEADVP